GWGWLIFDKVSRRLMLIQMESQQDRFVTGSVPILGIDVWEHAYYLKYQNKRSDYVKAFRNVVNWKFCEWMFEQAAK
ncbi:MAG: superoxide dismutase, partial [Phycisphaerae bacterium]